MTRQAFRQAPPEPSAKEDPGEWRAFFRQIEGRDMPLNAQYEANKHRIEADAPPDVGGIAAEYFERNDPLQGFDPDELTAEREGVTVEALRIFREGPGAAEEMAEEQGISVEQFYAGYGIDRNGKPIAAAGTERQAAADPLRQPAPEGMQVKQDEKERRQSDEVNVPGRPVDSDAGPMAVDRVVGDWQVRNGPGLPRLRVLFIDASDDTLRDGHLVRGLLAAFGTAARDAVRLLQEAVSQDDRDRLLGDCRSGAVEVLIAPGQAAPDPFLESLPPYLARVVPMQSRGHQESGLRGPSFVRWSAAFIEPESDRRLRVAERKQALINDIMRGDRPGPETDDRPMSMSSDFVEAASRLPGDPAGNRQTAAADRVAGRAFPDAWLDTASRRAPGGTSGPQRRTARDEERQHHRPGLLPFT